MPPWIVVRLVPVVEPTVVAWSVALLPKPQVPVPQFIDIDVAPVPFPMVIALALEPVPILTAPVVPESRVTALVVVDCNVRVEPPVTVKAPELLRAVDEPRLTVPEPACRVRLPEAVVKLEAVLELSVMAPALLLPMLTAPVEVPVLMLVAKLEEALMLVVAPEMVAPAEPVRRPAEVIVPDPEVEISPEVVISSPAVAGCRVVPLLVQ